MGEFNYICWDDWVLINKRCDPLLVLIPRFLTSQQLKEVLKEDTETYDCTFKEKILYVCKLFI